MTPHKRMFEFMFISPRIAEDPLSLCQVINYRIFGKSKMRVFLFVGSPAKLSSRSPRTSGVDLDFAYLRAYLVIWCEHSTADVFWPYSAFNKQV